MIVIRDGAVIDCTVNDIKMGDIVFVHLPGVVPKLINGSEFGAEGQYMILSNDMGNCEYMLMRMV